MQYYALTIMPVEDLDPQFLQEDGKYLVAPNTELIANTEGLTRINELAASGYRVAFIDLGDFGTGTGVIILESNSQSA